MIDYRAEGISPEEEAEVREKAQEALRLNWSMEEFAVSDCGSWERRYGTRDARQIKRSVYREEEAVKSDLLLTVPEIVDATGVSVRRLSDMLGIPHRTFYSWTQGTNTPSDWVTRLINFRVFSDPRFRAALRERIERKAEAEKAKGETG